VISAVDADDIYRIPICCDEQALDDIVVDKLRLEVPPTDLAEWRQVVSSRSIRRQVDIRQVGKYVQIRDSYLSLHEALMQRRAEEPARASISTTVESTISSRRHPRVGRGRDSSVRGFRRARHRGQDPGGALRREQGVPYLGICLGMQWRSWNSAVTCWACGCQQHRVQSCGPHPVIALYPVQACMALNRDGLAAHHAPAQLGRQLARVTSADAAGPRTETSQQHSGRSIGSVGVSEADVLGGRVAQNHRLVWAARSPPQRRLPSACRLRAVEVVV